MINLEFTPDFFIKSVSDLEKGVLWILMAILRRSLRMA